MTNFQHCQMAVTPKACLKKTTELFYVTHPKAPKALLGPFLSQADAECGRVVMRSADAVVTARLVGSIDDIAHGHGVNNGRVCRAFAGADRLGANHGYQRSYHDKLPLRRVSKRRVSTVVATVLQCFRWQPRSL